MADPNDPTLADPKGNLGASAIAAAQAKAAAQGAAAPPPAPAAAPAPARSSADSAGAFSAGTSASGAQLRIGAGARTFMIGIATDGGPRLLAFQSESLKVGRMEDNDLCLNHGSVSRYHAKINVTARGVIVEDQNSRNGITVNGEPLAGSQAVRPGDIIRVGYVALFYFGFVQVAQPPRLELVDDRIVLVPLAPG